MTLLGWHFVPEPNNVDLQSWYLKALGNGPASFCLCLHRSDLSSYLAVMMREIRPSFDLEPSSTRFNSPLGLTPKVTPVPPNDSILSPPAARYLSSLIRQPRSSIVSGGSD